MPNHRSAQKPRDNSLQPQACAISHNRTEPDQVIRPAQRKPDGPQPAPRSHVARQYQLRVTPFQGSQPPAQSGVDLRGVDILCNPPEGIHLRRQIRRHVAIRHRSRMAPVEIGRHRQHPHLCTGQHQPQIQVVILSNTERAVILQFLQGSATNERLQITDVSQAGSLHAAQDDIVNTQSPRLCWRMLPEDRLAPYHWPV